MSLFEIKNRWNGLVIFRLECASFKECIEAAVRGEANLCGADLYGANLSGANLCGVNLYGANLYGANLSEANLSGANLSGANLSGANLSEASLCEADLYGANLSEANLSGANLSGADLTGIKNASVVLARTQICPQEGAFVGWKKLDGGLIARLVIPHDAQRLNAYGSRKCRASKAFVHEIFGAESGYDNHTGKTLYEVGKEVFPDSFNDDRRVECSNGIHFFMTKEEALDY